MRAAELTASAVAAFAVAYRHAAECRPDGDPLPMGELVRRTLDGAGSAEL